MFQESFKGVSKKLSKFHECFETVSRKFKAYWKSVKEYLSSCCCQNFELSKLFTGRENGCRKGITKREFGFQN